MAEASGDGRSEAVFATNVVLQPLVDEPSGSSLVRKAASHKGDFVTSTHDKPEIHTIARTIMAANPADPAEDLGFGPAAASSQPLRQEHRF